MKGFFLILVCFFVLIFPSGLEGGQVDFDVTFSANWARGELFGQACFDLAQAGLRLPTGRFMGEETLRQAYPQILQPHLLSLRVDSSSTIEDLVIRGEITLDDLYLISQEAGRSSPSLSLDLNRMMSKFSILIKRISTLLVTHRRVNEPPRPIIPASTTDYSGIIIIANEELPVHGRMTSALLEPCLFPRIWDTEMNLIYERTMFENSRERLMVRYAAPESIFRPSPTGLDGELLELAGPNPLRIIARQAFGVNPTDPVIHRDDAMRIISSENNRRLLREGRVVLVINEDQLITTFK